ncbi:hypothetical protein EDB81DRAFT_760636 [Dactylonectria macrodidyma]|uniref:Uncharacterized protein n=1 Tax=Dactylonectria macrodidyma TaxID=307937 RepID=A0A9P9J1C3_9HYPO|nr:hypothetical protein EDB81DRAFT_760636 [Dactylonectria macrodidyma]
MDSEPEALSLPLPVAEGTSAPTPDVPGSGGSATAPPTPASVPRSIQAVVVQRDVEKIRFAPWSATMIQVDHSVFPNPVVAIPRLKVIEVPMVFHREEYRDREDIIRIKANLAVLACTGCLTVPSWTTLTQGKWV